MAIEGDFTSGSDTGSGGGYGSIGGYGGISNEALANAVAAALGGFGSGYGGDYGNFGLSLGDPAAVYGDTSAPAFAGWGGDPGLALGGLGTTAAGPPGAQAQSNEMSLSGPNALGSPPASSFGGGRDFASTFSGTNPTVGLMEAILAANDAGPFNGPVGGFPAVSGPVVASVSPALDPALNPNVQVAQSAPAASPVASNPNPLGLSSSPLGDMQTAIANAMQGAYFGQPPAGTGFQTASAPGAGFSPGALIAAIQGGSSAGALPGSPAALGKGDLEIMPASVNSPSGGMQTASTPGGFDARSGGFDLTPNPGSIPAPVSTAGPMAPGIAVPSGQVTNGGALNPVATQVAIPGQSPASSAPGRGGGGSAGLPSGPPAGGLSLGPSSSFASSLGGSHYGGHADYLDNFLQQLMSSYYGQGSA